MPNRARAIRGIIYVLGLAGINLQVGDLSRNLTRTLYPTVWL